MKSSPSFKLFDVINSLLLMTTPAHEKVVFEPSPSFAATKTTNKTFFNHQRIVLIKGTLS